MSKPLIYRIVPVEGGQWMIVREDGEDRTAILGDRDFRDPEVAVAALQELARTSGMEMAVIIRPDGKIDRVEMGKRLHTDRPDVTLTLTLPALMADIVDEAADVMNVSRDEVMRRAILLLKVALDADQEGNRLAILTPDDEIVRDIAGFGPKGSVRQAATT